MRSLRALLLLAILSLAGRVQAQWLREPVDPCETGAVEFDRPHEPTSLHHRTRVLHAEQEIPDWPFPNENVSNYPFEDQTEPAIAIGPNGEIVIGANDDRNYSTLFSYERAGGVWNSNPLPIETQYQYATDPSVVFDLSGTVYFAQGRSDDAAAGFPPNDVEVFRSTNAGLDWKLAGRPFGTQPQQIDTMSDKFYITADVSASSPFSNRLYVAWVDQGTDAVIGPDTATRIVCAFSTDHGVTWSARRYLSPRGLMHAPVPVTTPSGVLIVTYIDYGNRVIYTARSTNGGSSFEAPVVVAQYRDLGPIVPPTIHGYPVIKTHLAVNSFPSIAVDRSNLHPGRSYVTWAAKGDDGRPHVFLAISTDEGRSWSEIRTIDNDTAATATDKFFAWIAVDPASGVVGVDYYDSRDDASKNKLVNLYLALSTDGGASFTSRRISNASTDPNVARLTRFDTLKFFGDYIGLAAKEYVWHPVWTDGRTGSDLDIYTAAVDPYLPEAVRQFTARDTNLADGKRAVVLRWDYQPQTVFGYPLGDYVFNLMRGTDALIAPGGGLREYLDTTVAMSGDYSYELLVTTAHGSSIKRVARTGTSGVGRTRELPYVTVHWSQQPPFVGEPFRIEVNSDRPVTVELEFYDELGRALGEREVSDGPSTRHLLEHTAHEEGVEFYTLRAVSSNGVQVLTGKLVVMEK